MSNRSSMRILFASTAVIGVLTLGACDRKDAGTAANATKSSGPAAKLAPADVQMKDIAENAANYAVGVSFDKSVGQYAGAAKIAQAFADKAVADFKAAAAKLPAVTDIARKPTLSLNVTSVANTTRFAAIAANGSQYLSGQGAQPILKRWVWLPESGSELTVDQLFPGTKAKSAIAAHANGGTLVGMEPIADAEGKIAAIYLVYAAPASDAEDAVDKFVFTAEQLKSMVDPKYASLLGTLAKP